MSETGSSSSFGSGLDSNCGSEAGPQNGRGEDEAENVHSLESGVFGALYTVSKEKAPSWPFVAFRLFMDWLQCFLLLVNPAYGWDINPTNKLWQAFSFIQLNYFMSVRGYTFFLICMYVLAVALLANLALCVWVAHSFQNNSFDHLWPIVVLRYFSLVFYQILDIASLTLFLMTMDCQYFSVDAAVQGYNQEFPNVYCWSMPHLIHVTVAAFAILVFFILATLFTMAEIELNPISHNLMGMAHTRVEVLGFGIRMFMTCVTVFVPDIKWMSCFQLIAAFWLCYLYLKWLPHLHAVINHVRVGTYFSVLCAAVLLIFMAFHPGLGEHDDALQHQQQQQLTIALWVLFVPAGLLGAACSWWRTRFFSETVVGKFRDAPADAKPQHIYLFTDVREVEVCSRCCRTWVDAETLDLEATALAERIVQAGMKLLPHEPYMAIWWSSYLIDVQGSYQTGYQALQAAKRMPHQSFLDRFCIFVRDQEHTQKASAASSGENASTDLVSYVEFQRNYRLVVHLHLEALIAKRTFWEVLLHHNVTFDKMAAAVLRIETSVRASERMYKQVLQRHGNSLKILQLYVKFLQGVRNDPWSAARWAAEVEKMQRAEEEANERAVFGDASDAEGGMKQTADDKGVIIMGANCLIRMINEPAATLFGYQARGELVGKNINVLVPPPFSRHHNNYVRTYIQTGVARIMNHQRSIVGMHKDRYVVPINMFITKVSGVGDDSVFMGLVSPATPEPGTGYAWIMQGGKVLSVDVSLGDWLGYKHEDVHGRAFSELVVEARDLEEVLALMRHDVPVVNANSASTGAGPTAPGDARTRSYTTKGTTQRGALTLTVHGLAATAPGTSPTGKLHAGAEAKGVSWVVEGLHLKHLYLDVQVAVDVTVTLSGIGDTAMHAFKIRRKEGFAATPCLMVTDNRGRVVHATTTLAAKLGVSVAKLQAGNMLHALDALLPPPFVRAHHQWYRDHGDVPPAWSCRSGLSMCLNAQGPEGPTVQPFHMQFKRREEVGREPLNVVLMEERTMDQLLDERRLALTLNSKGFVTASSQSPVSLFGFEPSALVGAHLCYILDVLRAGGPASLDPSGVMAPSQLMAEEDAATAMLMTMAQRSYDTPGMSWRVGVSAIIDPVSLMALGPIGMAMIGKSKVPAVMVVEAFLEPSRMDGARMLLPAETQLKVELWRADLLSGVLEVDSQGHVAYAGIKGQPAFSPHLLLGLPPAMITGALATQLLPLHGRPLLEALFTEGGLAPPKPASGKPGGAAAGPAGGRGAGVVRGGMRGGNQGSRRRGLGPLHTIKLPHCTDGADLELQVMAVVKQDIGSGCSLYVHLHPVAPRSGRPDFAAWLPSAPAPAPPFVRMLGRRGSLMADPNARSSFPKELGMQLMSGQGGNTTLMPMPPPPRSGVAAAGGIAARPSLEQPRTPRKGGFALMGDLDEAGNRDPSGLIPAGMEGLEEGVEEGLEEDTGMELPHQVLDPFKAVGQVSHKRSNVAFQGDEEDRHSTASSTAPELKAEGKQRISQWVMSGGTNGSVNGSKKKRPSNGAAGLGGQATGGAAKAAGAAAGDGNDPPPPPDEDEEEEEEEEEGGGQAGQQMHDADDEAEMAELDEANSGLNDYKRGKRLKKLVKVLLSPQAQTHNVRLKWVSVLMVILLITVDLAMFMTFMQLVNVQIAQVDDLRSSAKGVNRVMTVSMSVSAVCILLGGKGNPNLRYLGQGGDQHSLDYQYKQMDKRVADMEMYHSGVYRGFNKVRALPTQYNLRSIWEEPNLPVRMFYKDATDTFAKDKNMSLWDAGLNFIRAANNIVQTKSLYQLGNSSADTILNSTDVLYILYNGPRSIMTAYQDTLDGLMQKSIDDSKTMNSIQLVILAIEGGLVGVLSVVVMWFMTARVVMRRYAVFNIFMTVPSGIIRALATVAFNLEEGADDEAQGEEEGARQEGGGDAELGSGKKYGGGNDGSGNQRAGTVAVVAGPTVEAPPPPPVSMLGRVASSLMFWATPPPAAGSTKVRRKLKPSLRAILLMTWPFMLWAVFVISINVAGYTELAGMSEPIAVSNIVQFMSIRMNRVLFFAQRCVGEEYFDTTGSFTAPILPKGVYNPLKQGYNDRLWGDYNALLLEYDAMLFGNKAPSLANQTSPHFQLATTGIVFTKGADIMYSSTDCMCQNQADCQPPSSLFYRYTSHGLDTMLKQLFYNIESLILLPLDQTNTDSEEFKYLWEVGNGDVYGGLSLLVDVYSQEVKNVYRSALTLHVVAFCMCCGLGAMFIVLIMRPANQRVMHEAKRCAELLAQLPAETNVEAMVSEALRLKDAPVAAGAAAIAAGGSLGGKPGAMRAASFGSEEDGGLRPLANPLKGSGGEADEWGAGKARL